MNKDIETVVEKIPQLTDFGIGIYQRFKGTREERLTEFKKQQEILLNSEEAFYRVVEWLEDKPKRKSINYKHTSYGLKHIAEKKIGYITNGVFIAAMVHCGFDYKQISGSPNVRFNISEKGLKG